MLLCHSNQKIKQMEHKPYNYNQMSAEEQLQFVQQLNEFETLSLPILEPFAKGGTMNAEQRKAMSAGMHLLLAFPFSRDFAEKALRFGDFERRCYRLRHYVNKMKDEVSKEVLVRTADGNAFAYVPKMQQQFRRRGRPTREEAAAMARAAASQQVSDIETKKMQAIAQLLGVEIVTNQTIREKNNDELAEERKAKEDAQAKQNPSLFDSPVNGGTAAVSSQEVLSTLPPSAFDRATLSQLSFLLSPELAERVANVRELRNRASVAAETAKVMAQRGDKPDEVEVYAQEAAENTEAYERIYEDVDAELATVYLRLKEDPSFRTDFVTKHYKSVPPVAVSQQLSSLEKLLKPYANKQDKDFVAKVRQMIADNNPEVVAEKKAAAEKKVAVEKIIKYLRRQDKENTARRVEGMEKKYAELVELMGEQEAKPFYAFVEKAREDLLAKKK